MRNSVPLRVFLGALLVTAGRSSSAPRRYTHVSLRKAAINHQLLEAAGAFQKNRNGEHCPELILLLKKGADPNARDQYGETALIAAASWSYRDTVVVLLRHGADVNAKSNDGTTALIFASSRNDPTIVRMLLRRGARVNTRTRDHKTALYYARKNDLNSNVLLLTKAGARH
jgi:ankyrin repeat protein